MDDQNDQGTRWPLPVVPSESQDTTTVPLSSLGARLRSESEGSITSHSPPISHADSEKADIAHAPSPSISDQVLPHGTFQNGTNPSQMLGSVDLDIVKVITEQVIKHIESKYNIHAASPGPARSQKLPESPQSPDFSSVASFPQSYTPPSPVRKPGVFEIGNESVSPQQISGAASRYLHEMRDSGPGADRSLHSNDAIPRPPRDSDFYHLQTDREDSCTRSESKGSIKTPNNIRSHSIDVNRKNSVDTTTTRPNETLPRESSNEMTALEKAWQPLFDSGRPTSRLSQFLRGLAKHLIEDFEPKGSLVVTPVKMLRFFEETLVSGEVYPWLTIYGKMKHTSLCVMYRKLLCQHHLVQTHVQESPTVPGLTPYGFEAFMTCLIRAHPDIEFRRLAKAVRDMPISNADDPRERFPKELSRRLFPDNGEVQAEQRLISSLSHEMPLVNLEHAATAMPPPPNHPPPAKSSQAERGRSLCAQSNRSSNSVDADSVSPPAVQIERQRQPYYAKERSGKMYDRDGTKEREQVRGQDTDRTNKGQPANPPRLSRASPGLARSSSYKTARHHQQNTDSNRKPVSQSFAGSKGVGYPASARRSSTPPRYNYSPNDYRGFPLPQYTNNGPIDSFRDPFSDTSNDARHHADGQSLERARTTNDGPPPDRSMAVNDGHSLDRSRTTNDDDRSRGRPRPGRNVSQSHN